MSQQVSFPPHRQLNILGSMVVSGAYFLRDKLGRFMKGAHGNPATEFKKGQTWHLPQPWWNKQWLTEQYVKLQKSADDIANENNTTRKNIQYFLKKFGIRTRSIAEARKVKHWGLTGEKNGMHGKTGQQNPKWNGGHSPERQCSYARAIWKALRLTVLERDNYRCQDCVKQGRKKDCGKLQVHHIKPWSRYPELRFALSNLVTLGIRHHKLRHKKMKKEVQHNER